MRVHSAMNALMPNVPPYVLSILNAVGFGMISMAMAHANRLIMGLN